MKEIILMAIKTETQLKEAIAENKLTKQLLIDLIDSIIALSPETGIFIDGIGNTGGGAFSLYNLISGINNTAFGNSTLLANTTGYRNTVYGYNSMYNNTTGYYNTSSGSLSLHDNTDGYLNSAFGYFALRFNSSYFNSSGFGSNSAVTGSNQVQLGDSATTTYVYGTVQNRSDERDKADVTPSLLGLDFILNLQPVDYKWDMREDYAEIIEEEVDVDGVKEKKISVIEHERDGSKKRERFHHGFIAQQVRDSGFDFGGFQDHSIAGGKDVLSLGYDEFIAPMVKAIQEQQEMINELKLRIETLEK